MKYLSILVPSRGTTRVFTTSRATSTVRLFALPLLFILGISFLYFTSNFNFSPTGMVVISGENASYVYDGPQEIVFTNQVVMDLSSYFNASELTYLATIAQGANVSVQDNILSIQTNGSYAEYNITIIASTGNEFLSVPLTFTDDNTLDPTPVAYPFSQASFTFENQLGIPLDTLSIDYGAQQLSYSHQPLDLVGVESRIVLAGVTPFSSSIKARIGKTTNPEYMQTEIFAINEIGVTSATLTLAKYGEVETIYQCSDYNTQTFSCNAFWAPTGIPFNQNSTHVWFSVESFSAYGGGGSGAGGSSGGFASQEFVNVTTCGVLTQNTTLISDIVGETGSCFTINQSYTSLNCLGHTIEYDASGVDGVFGIRASNLTNISIENCRFKDTTVAGADVLGLWLDNVSNATIYNSTFIGNGTHGNIGAKIERSSDNLIFRNNSVIVQGNGSGIQGIHLNFSHNTTISGSNFTLYGIIDPIGMHLVNSTQNNTLYGNRVFVNGSGNNHKGIRVYGSNSFITLLENSVHVMGAYNNSGGIVIDQDNQNISMLQNRVFMFAQHNASALHITNNSINSLVRNNTFIVNNTNQSSLILLSDSITNTLIYNNTLQLFFNGSVNTGIRLHNFVDSTRFFRNTLLSNNTLFSNITNTSNFTEQSLLVGVHLSNNSDSNIIEQNFIYLNQSTHVLGAIIENSSKENTLTNNSFTLLAINNSRGVLLSGANQTIFANSTLRIDANSSTQQIIGIHLGNDTFETTVDSNSLLIYHAITAQGILANSTGTSNHTFSNNFVLLNTTTQSKGLTLYVGNNSVLDNEILLQNQGDLSYAIQLQNSDSNQFLRNKLNVFGSLGLPLFLNNSHNNTFEFTNISAPNGSTALVLSQSNFTSFVETHLQDFTNWIVQNNNTYNSTFFRTTFNRTNGSIFLFETFGLNGTQTLDLTDIDITFNRAFINSTKNPFLNLSANISFEDLQLINPFVRFAQNDLDFIDCPANQCSIVNLSLDSIIFNVSQFSTYSVGGGCGNISSNIQLTSNVSITGSCFEINQSNLVLDCTGHTLFWDSAGEAGSFAVKSNNKTNITIQNCQFIDNNPNGTSNVGINFTNTNQSRIINTTIITQGQANNTGLFINGSYNNSFSNLQIFTNGSSQDYGLHLKGSDSNIFNSLFINSTSSSLGHALYLERSRFNQFNQTQIDTLGVDSYGIFFESSSLDNLFNNTLLIDPTQWINSSNADLGNNFSNLTLRNLNGSIEFIDQVIVNLSNDISQSIISLTHNNTFVNSSAIPLFNVSAQITFYNITYNDTPEVIADFEDNGSFIFCSIGNQNCTPHSYNVTTGTFVFNVSQFTTYRATRPGNFLIFSSSVPPLSIDQHQQLVNVLDLSVFYFDPEGENIGYAVSGPGSQAITISPTGQVSLDGTGLARGSYDVFFQGSDSSNVVSSNRFTLTVTGPDSNAFPSGGGGGGGVKREDRIEFENETHVILKSEDPTPRKLDELPQPSPNDQKVVEKPAPVITRNLESEQQAAQQRQQTAPATESPQAISYETVDIQESTVIGSNLSWLLYAGLALIAALFLSLFIVTKKVRSGRLHPQDIAPIGPAPAPQKTKLSVMPLSSPSKPQRAVFQSKEQVPAPSSLKNTFNGVPQNASLVSKIVAPKKEEVKVPVKKKEILPVPILKRILPKKQSAKTFVQRPPQIKPPSQKVIPASQKPSYAKHTIGKLKKMVVSQRLKEISRITTRPKTLRIQPKDRIPLSDSRKQELSRKINIAFKPKPLKKPITVDVKKELGTKRQDEIDKLFKQLLSLQERTSELTKKIEKKKKKGLKKKK